MKQTHADNNSLAETRSKGRILVADDDSVCQYVIRLMLEKAGYHVEVVADGKAAMSALDKAGFDLVYMDCMMPVMDGFEATKNIRARDPEAVNSGIPVIALTGLSTSSDHVKCLNAGMDDYLKKPVQRDRLLAMTERFLAKVAGEAVPAGSTGQQQGNEDSEAAKAEARPKPALDEGFVDRLVGRFCEEIPQTISELNMALKHDDLAALQAAGHRLRGAADVIGFSKISVLASALEQAGSNSEATLAASLTAKLTGELENLSKALSESG